MASFTTFDVAFGPILSVKIPAQPFLPLYAGLADETQAARLVEHLLNPDEYAPDNHTRYLVPSAS